MAMHLMGQVAMHPRGVKPRAWVTRQGSQLDLNLYLTSQTSPMKCLATGFLKCLAPGALWIRNTADYQAYVKI